MNFRGGFLSFNEISDYLTERGEIFNMVSIILSSMYIEGEYIALSLIKIKIEGGCWE